MLIACWSVKGGSGTTVTAAALALLLAERAPGGAVLADLAGDAPAVLGLPEPPGPGLAAWLSAGDDLPEDALARLEVPATSGLRLLPLGPAGPARPTPDAGERLAAALAGPRAVVVDCGKVDGPGQPGAVVAAVAGVSLLVLRPCYLALRRAVAAPVRPSAVILVDEPGRALSRRDVEDVLGVPVRAVVPVDPTVARAVDAGLLPARLPRVLARALRAAA